MNHRRRRVLAAGLSPLASSFAGLAQQRMRRIGSLSLGKSASETAQLVVSRGRESFRRTGWEEGRNLIVERRWAEGEVARLDILAEELVRLDVEVIVATFNEAIAAAKRATNSIPIVMLAATLPVELGFVQSLAHPGGNVTGTASQGPETAAKSLQILKEVAPGRTRLAFLFNPTGLGVQAFTAARIRAAEALGMSVQLFPVARPEDLAPALDRIAASRVEMIHVSLDGVTEPRLRDIASFAIRHKILCSTLYGPFPGMGGAISYAPNGLDFADRTISYVDRILRGAKPADLPVEEPTRFDLIINLRTMRAIGVTVPQSVLLRADEVIE
jgi:putative tryptophan/tyrosine transport system substrate-binding protein